jgi:hypothetical protein
VCCTVDACSFIYGFFPVSILEENSCVVSLNVRLIESYVCSTTYHKCQVTTIYYILVLDTCTGNVLYNGYLLAMLIG